MMTFGEAIKNMQHGLKVSRAGWNGRGMYVFVASVTMATDVNGESFEPKDPYPCLVLKAADDRLVFGWLASQTDMLATDWGVVDGWRRSVYDRKAVPPYSEHPCAKCGAFKVRVILEDEADGRGTYDDIKCLACGHHYKTDGPDA